MRDTMQTPATNYTTGVCNG